MEDVIINVSPVFKRLEEKQHTEMFSEPVLYGNETVCFKPCFFKK